jgi:hypothetical protein
VGWAGCVGAAVGAVVGVAWGELLQPAKVLATTSTTRIFNPIIFKLIVLLLAFYIELAGKLPAF